MITAKISTIIMCMVIKRNKLPLYGIIHTTLLLMMTVILEFSERGKVDGLKITEVDIPSHPLTGNNVELYCKYDLESDTLYSVKWYRNEAEFYRYVPGDSNPIQTFSQPGVSVYQAMSDQEKVTLKSISLESSGKYRCEVSADSPSFHTETDDDEMLVVEMPEGDPTISGGLSRYHVGDPVNVNCTSMRSRPAASLEWYINGEKVTAESDKLVQYMPINDSDGLETSVLGLRFEARPQHFPAGQLGLKCTATIAAVYHLFTEESVEGQMLQTGPVLGSIGSGMYAGVSNISLCDKWIQCLLMSLAVQTIHILINL